MYEIFTCTCNRVIHRNAQSLSSEFQRYCTICIKCRVRANLNTPPPQKKEEAGVIFLWIHSSVQQQLHRKNGWSKSSCIIYKQYNENLGLYNYIVCNTWNWKIAECSNLTLCNNVWLAFSFMNLMNCYSNSWWLTFT